MTTIYVAVPLETAKQAGALPVGTLAISSEDYDDGTVMHWAAVKVSNVWARTDVADGLPLIGDAAMVDADVPWTALVPIEVHPDTLCKTYGEVHACRPALVPVGDIDWIAEARATEGDAL